MVRLMCEYHREIVACYHIYESLEKKADTIGLNKKETEIYNCVKGVLQQIDNDITDKQIDLYSLDKASKYVKSFYEWDMELFGGSNDI